MAKTGFQYYSVETDRYQDKRIRKLKKGCGCNGLAVYDYILCEIYRVQGCFLEWDESTAFDVADYLGLKETQVNEIVNYCCAVGLFNKELLTSERVLTSASIQSRFIDWSSLAKRKGVKIPEKYLILPEEVGKIPEEPTEVPEDLDKVKKSKVTGSKEKFLAQGSDSLPPENGKPPPVAPPPSGIYPGEGHRAMHLADAKVQQAVERVKRTSGKIVTAKDIIAQWEIFKGLYFSGDRFYRSENEIFNHFSNWVKDQKFDNGAKAGVRPNGSSGASALAARLADSITARGS